MEGLILIISSTSGGLLVASFQGFDFDFVKRFSNLFLVMRCVHVVVVGFCSGLMGERCWRC